MRFRTLEIFRQYHLRYCPLWSDFVHMHKILWKKSGISSGGDGPEPMDFQEEELASSM